MQTLTSVRRRGWYGQIASLPLSFFLSFFLFSLLRPLVTLRQIWTNESLKHVVPHKEVPFAGLNDVPLNTTYGFVFVGVTAFRWSKSLSKPTFVDISQSVLRYNYFRFTVLKNKHLLY